MPNPSFQDQFVGAVRVQQFIIVALILGCLTFGVILIVENGQDGLAVNPPATPMITYIALFNAVVVLIVFFVARSIMAAKTRREALAIAKNELGDSRDALSTKNLFSSSDVVRVLLRGSQVRLLVGAALFEGGAFFCLIAYLAEDHPLALAAAFFLVLCIALQFPTKARVASWIMQQAQSIYNEQQFSRK